MEMLVLCRCGHPTGLHTEHGCRAGRYQPCECLRDAPSAVNSAIDVARAKQWRRVRDAAREEAHK
jgi:hypothetical protein